MTAKYIADLPLYHEEKPYVLKYKPPPGVRRSNVVLVPHSNIPVRNVRGLESTFHLDHHGFVFRTFPLEQSLDSVAGIERHLLDIQSFLKPVLGTEDVRVFEYKVGVSFRSINHGER